MSGGKVSRIAHKSQSVTDEREAGDMQASENVVASEVGAGAHAHEATASAARPGILHNKHDANKAAEEVGKVLTALAKLGVPVDINQITPGGLRARIDAYAACRLLIAKGIATEDEVVTEAFTALRSLLLDILASVERQRLTEGKQVQAVRTPGLVIARH